ncbi:hypothetical protein EDF75_1994 [Raoultella sp. BIGb0149]|nr:hypothetical protein EDF75_1994 [Raoultella sp. BIGb0149]VDY59465.1 Uncharacterised protein [Klebsiella pneumoniae]
MVLSYIQMIIISICENNTGNMTQKRSLLLKRCPVLTAL